MAVTRSRAAERPAVRRDVRPRVAWRARELAWLLAASVLVLVGLYLVYKAKAAPLAEIDRQLAGRKLLNLNRARRARRPAAGARR